MTPSPETGANGWGRMRLRRLIRCVGERRNVADENDQNAARELTEGELEAQEADVLPERAAMSIIDGRGVINPTPPLPETGFVSPHEAAIEA
jgi:hypothetical protein